MDDDGAAAYRILYYENHCFTRTDSIVASSDVEAIVIAARRAGQCEFELWRGEERIRSLRNLPPQLA